MKARQIVGRILTIKETSSVLMLLATVLIFHALSPYFLSYYNLRTLLELFPEFGILVLGVTLLMISGEFDLSVGSVFALCPILIIEMVYLNVNIAIATVLALLVSLAIGALNATIVVKTGIPSFIVTLATMMCWRGAVLAASGGTPPPIPKQFSIIEKYTVSWIGPIRISFIYFVVILIIFWILLERTRFGNWVFASGGNPEAARARGISPAKVKFICFMLTSLLAAFAGVIEAARIGSALPSAGTGWELDAIAASVIGGTSLFGGVGSVVAAVIGAFLLRIIGNGLVLAGAPGFYFRTFVGIIIILAVIFNIIIKKRALKIRW